MTKIVVYLAGDLLKPGWRNFIIDNFKDCEGIEFLSPSGDELTNNKDPKLYVIRDITLIHKADILFAYIRDRGHKYSGTSAEIGLAKALGKPIIIVIENEAKFTNQFYFITQIADSVTNYLEKGMEILEYAIP